jgi:4,5-DOPA dioxygenase extradiol
MSDTAATRSTEPASEAGPAPDTTMPAAFIGHGSPMNALETNRYTEAWSAFGASIPRPRAILAISAHWYTNATAVTAMTRPRTIHDFYGFPRALFDVEYPAPGAPELVDEIAAAVKPTWVGPDADQWGFDHGTWSVLVHAFPGADVPVVQLAINGFQPLDYHLELGRALAPLRRSGVLILGSGNVVHNLGAADFSKSDTGFAWAHDFNEAAMAQITDGPGDIGRLQGHKAYDLAVPTPDHFLPFVYLAGLASADDQPVEVMADGYAAGSLSMTSYSLGL